jgi:predicted metal-dependent hydrolase
VGEVIRLDDPDILVRLRRSRAARRFTLSLRPGEDAARLTLPARAPLAEAERFLERQSDWLRGAVDRIPAAESVRIGTVLPVDGFDLRIVSAGHGRAVLMEGGALLAPASRTGPAVAGWLKLRARNALVPAAEAAAERLGRRLGRVTLRDTRSRWGSCTARGDLSFSWRLAMAPPEIQRYVAIHEAAHLVEMNHSPAFWALVAGLCPDYRARRAWLRRNGGVLHRFRFDAI